MKKISDYSAVVEKTIRDITLPTGELASLYEPVSYAMAAGGKRLRPALLLMTADSFGGEEVNAADPAIGIELFHNFTLLHDDVMDNSETRRGRQSVYAKWDINTAILSGDTMLTLATEYISHVADKDLRQVLNIFNAMALRVYEGQRLDMDFESKENISIDMYLRMIGDKTGSLLGASARIGAIIGGATEKDAALMQEFGEMLGIAFQIQDDWLDVFGDSTTFGKPIGGDINNNKKSYLYLRALEAGGPEAEALAEAMRLPAGDTKVKVVTRLYEKMNISELCRQTISAYSAKALAALRGTSLSDEQKEPFRLLVEKLTGRKK